MREHSRVGLYRERGVPGRGSGNGGAEPYGGAESGPSAEPRQENTVGKEYDKWTREGAPQRPGSIRKTPDAGRVGGGGACLTRREARIGSLVVEMLNQELMRTDRRGNLCINRCHVFALEAAKRATSVNVPPLRLPSSEGNTDVSRNRASTGVTLRVQPLHTQGSGTLGSA